MALSPTSNQTPEQKKAAQDDVLMREIDDAVRQDQYTEFFARYGKPLLGALALFIASLGLYLLWWQPRQHGAMEERSETLVAALDQLQAGNLDTAASTLADMAGEGGDSAVIAALLQAGIASEQGKPEEAARIYARLAADEGTPAEMRDLAAIREVAVTYDKLKPADVIARLKPLAVPGNPYFGSAGELVAMAYLDQGKRAEAGTLFGEIAKNEDVPESLRFRARQMAGLLGVDAIEDVDEVLEEIAVGEDAAAPAQ